MGDHGEHNVHPQPAFVETRNPKHETPIASGQLQLPVFSRSRLTRQRTWGIINLKLAARNSSAPLRLCGEKNGTRNPQLLPIPRKHPIFSFRQFVVEIVAIRIKGF
jgi:hypothetical protein